MLSSLPGIIGTLHDMFLQHNLGDIYLAQFLGAFMDLQGFVYLRSLPQTNGCMCTRVPIMPYKPIYSVVQFRP